MNRIDVLLKTPFSSLSIEEKLEIKKLGAHEPRVFKPASGTPWGVVFISEKSKRAVSLKIR
jgi:hypothetical protein